MGQMEEGGGWAEGRLRGKFATGKHKHGCKALSGDVTDPLVAILEVTTHAEWKTLITFSALT